VIFNPRLWTRALAAAPLAVAFLGLGLPSAAWAATSSVSGSITSASPTSTRLTPGTCATSGITTHYFEIDFQTSGNDLSATTLSMTVTPSGFRAVATLYQGAFLPGSPDVNCYVQAVEGAAVGSPVSITAGYGQTPGFPTENWALVVATDGSTDTGGFTASITSSNTALTITSPTTTKTDQTITFTSTPPASPVVGGSYTVSATGGGSGQPVVFSIDAASAGVCTIAGSTVSFTATGTCTVDANQAGDANYNPAPQAQQNMTVAAAPVASVVGQPGASTGSTLPKTGGADWGWAVTGLVALTAGMALVSVARRNQS
jgi:LPXTG-motif cell wall-anchored protein